MNTYLSGASAVHFAGHPLRNERRPFWPPPIADSEYVMQSSIGVSRHVRVICAAEISWPAS